MPTPNVHELNGRQAAALAQFIASKNQPKDGKLLVQPVQGAQTIGLSLRVGHWLRAHGLALEPLAGINAAALV